MLSIYRTTDTPPLAVIRSEQSVLFVPWSSLLALRELIAALIKKEEQLDEGVMSISSEAFISRWTIIPSLNNDDIFYGNDGKESMPLSRSEWRELARLLYVGDSLLTPTEAAQILQRPRQRVTEMIATGALFAFERPGKNRRKWLIPRSVIIGNSERDGNA